MDAQFLLLQNRQNISLTDFVALNKINTNDLGFKTKKHCLIHFCSSGRTAAG